MNKNSLLMGGVPRRYANHDGFEAFRISYFEFVSDFEIRISDFAINFCMD